MAVSYVVQKCTSCAGTKFDYDKETKMWKCLYCGAVIERHEQADTMFTIKNVVRQVILDIAYKRMDNARNNLVECKKIDSGYVGTIIADIAYEMNMIVNGGISKSEQQNYFSMLKKNYSSLRSRGDNPDDEELSLYEFFDSSEVVGVLILVFDSLNASARKEILLKNFNADEVYSRSLNSNLINFAIKNGDFDMFNQIIRNSDNIDVKAVLKTLLSKSPDDEKKAENAIFLIKKDLDISEEDKKTFEKYMNDSADSAETKCRIATALCTTQVRPSVECLMTNIITQNMDSQLIYELMAELIRNNLLDTEIYTILEFTLVNCGYEVCMQNINMLLESDNFVSLNSNHFISLLDRDDLTLENKKKVIEAMMKFEVSDKVRYRFISEYLCNVYDEPDNRLSMINFLLSLTKDLSTNTVENYIKNCSMDKENKPEIVKTLFSLDLNRSYFNHTLSNYISGNSDSFDVQKDVIYQLLQAGLRINANACTTMICMTGIPSEQRVEMLRLAKSSGVSYDDVADMYISVVHPTQFEPAIFGELMQGVTHISNNGFVRYVLHMPDLPAAKVGSIGKMMTICYSKPYMINCNIMVGSDKIICNLIQAYILTTKDTEELALGVLGALDGNKSTVGTDIDVSGVRYKFKKYVTMKLKMGELANMTKALCSQCRVL
ncbi:MAG: hypothetical protein IJ192_11425 [Clostridia bacterium]|nr:hypothetical protein [Clostridia bacterium]